ncbi:MAG: hypothetical protein ACJAQ4_001435 [Cryomorphaceae bacterium]|jgi:hypothetical protein
MSSKSAIVILFLLAHSVLLLMMVFTFPKINAQIGTQAFDLKTFGYTQGEVILILQNLDQPTTDFYIFPQLLLLDILYPILLALFLSTLIVRISNLISVSPKSIFSNLFILPFIAMFIDYFENILILVMITNPAEVSSGVIASASIFTQMKGAFTTVSWIVILVLFVIWQSKKWRAKSELPIKT